MYFDFDVLSTHTPMSLLKHRSRIGHRLNQRTLFDKVRSMLFRVIADEHANTDTQKHGRLR